MAKTKTDTKPKTRRAAKKPSPPRRYAPARRKAPPNSPRKTRPSTYDPKTVPAEARRLAEMGCVNAEIAKGIGISEETLYAWQLKYPEFAEAIAQGKRPINEKIKASAIDRCFPTEVTETTYEKGENGQMVIVERKVKTVLPNAGHLAFMLKNRLPEEFKEKHEVELPRGTRIQVEVVSPGDPDAEGDDQ